MLREIRDVVGDDVPSYTHYPKLIFCRNVIKEALRLVPVVPHSVRLFAGETEMEYEGVKIAPGVSEVYGRMLIVFLFFFYF
jgi:hypothetical protein